MQKGKTNLNACGLGKRGSISASFGAALCLYLVQRLLQAPAQLQLVCKAPYDGLPFRQSALEHALRMDEQQYRLRVQRT